MAERALRVGQTVELTGKDARGTVAFIGTTTFATGKWIGVVLDSPKGKNNGTVQGKSYFQCPDNHGVFVRHSQLTVLGEPSDSPMASPRTASDTPTQSSKSAEKAGASRSRKMAASHKVHKTPGRLPVLGAAAKGSSQGDLTELSVTPIKDTAQASDSAAKRASFVEVRIHI
ncbi:hypothetical protein B566_EDAN006170 [Ephemera danica]|nr:hypothetical protein B566_EDAN006170 [Ephemera danica]